MEAAAATAGLAERLRERRLEREFSRLRPLGEAYLLRRFNGQLSRADAEDAVAEVLARLHRRIGEGHVPHNLRATFLTAARNAAIDLLRSRRVRPTAPLEAAAGAEDEGPRPSEFAESRENSVRLQEALARMRRKYGEAIVLRFGLGLTVPEIAKHFEISLPAAKKLMLRATRQAKERLMAIEGAQFCPEMRELARSSLFEKQASGLADEAEAEVLWVHLAHCGACRSFAVRLHDQLHELGSAGLLGLAAGERLGAPGALDLVGHWLGAAVQGAEAGAEKARQLALRASGALPSSEGAAGTVVGTGQKVIALCGVGAAATATCVVTGAVGPGLSVSPPAAEGEPTRPPARVSTMPVAAPQVEASPPAAPVDPSPPPAPGSDGEEGVGDAAPPTPSPPPPAEPPPSEFGFEGGHSGSGSAPPRSQSSGSGGAEFGDSTSPPRESGGSTGSDGVGFQG